jgi:hypothetical protein
MADSVKDYKEIGEKSREVKLRTKKDYITDDDSFR